MIDRIRESASALAELLAASAHNVGRMARTDGTEAEVQSEATVAAGYLSALLRVIDRELHTIFLPKETITRNDDGALVVSWCGLRLVIRADILAAAGFPPAHVRIADHGPTIKALVDDVAEHAQKLRDLDLRIRMAEGRLDTGDTGPRRN